MPYRLMTLALILLPLAGPAFAQDTSSKPEVGAFRVQAVHGNEAVLENVKTNAATRVKVGDRIGGWTVVTITPLVVELEREGERGMRIRGRLPVQQPVPPPPSHP